MERYFQLFVRRIFDSDRYLLCVSPKIIIVPIDRPMIEK